MHIRITSIPPGFPPDEIRQHWVGVEIPLANPEQPFGEERGLSINPRTLEISEGVSFVVNAYDALKALYKKAPQTEQWFVENGLVFDEDSIGQLFSTWSFHIEYCELCL